MPDNNRHGGFSRLLMWRTSSGGAESRPAEVAHAPPPRRTRSKSLPDALLVQAPLEADKEARASQEVGDRAKDRAPEGCRSEWSERGSFSPEEVGLSDRSSLLQMLNGSSQPSHSSRPPRESFKTSISLHSKASLLALEEELSRPVPELLETMNHASSEVNTLERQAGEAQVSHRQLLDRWTRMHEELRGEHGSAFDRARPYFDAIQVLTNVSERVQAIVREFSAATSQHEEAKAELRSIERSLAYGAHQVTLDGDQQDGLSRATVKVLLCQQERDRREQEYARTLREYTEAQEAAEAWKAQIGESTIRRLTPCFRSLAQHQSELAAEQARANELSARLKEAKSTYSSSLRELDRINVDIHSARKAYADASGIGSSGLEASEVDDEDKMSEVASAVFGDDFQPQAFPSAREMPAATSTAVVPPPEVSPEVPSDGEDDGPFS
mmetsp:Transcript_38902/g.91628  ORF Transcript_38902/g.91628 Transcript_38902/m.91628 type:complete len:441 (-) Transcript_38902:61-1383(-)